MGMSGGPAPPAPEFGEVLRRLEGAGAIFLMAPLVDRGWAPAVVRRAADLAGPSARPTAGAALHPKQLPQMREALRWIELIPADRDALRQIVAARSLVHPGSRRHLFSWGHLAAVLDIPAASLRARHAEAIRLIVAALAGCVGLCPDQPRAPER